MFGVQFHSARHWYWIALGMFALGLMSKPMLLTLPFVLLLLDFWPLRRMGMDSWMNGLMDSWRKRRAGTKPLVQQSNNPQIHPSFNQPSAFSLQHLLVEKVPFFVLTIASCAISYLGVKAGGSIISGDKVSWGLRLANVPVSYARYLGKLFWPSDLIALYPMPTHLPGWQVGGAMLLLVVITLIAVRRARSAPYLIVGWLFFLGVLFPTIGLVQAGFQAIADRYTYIPSIGIFIAVVWALAEVQGPMSNVQNRETDHAPRSTLHVAFSLLAAVALLICSYLTWVQAGYWRNGLTLWSHCVAVCPDNAFARYNLGYVFQHANRTGEAMDQYRAALRVKPDHLDANLNLGIALIAVGQAQQATNYLGAAMRIKPDYAKPYNALGLALFELGDYAGAVARSTEAIRLDPADFGSYINMARALSALGKSDEALGYYAEGLRLNPAIPQSHYYLGMEWMKRGAFDQAAASFGEALRLAPGFEEARTQQQRALDQIKPPQMDTDGHR